MDMLWPFYSLVPLIPAVLMLAGWWLVRFKSQIEADRYRATYELFFPSGMTHDQILDFVRSVVTQLQRPTMFKPAYAISFEKYADQNGKHYYLHIPGHVHANVDKLVEKKIEGVSMEPVRPVDDLVRTTVWEYAHELAMRGDDTFFIVDPKSTASSIDANFEHLSADEAMVLQWIVIPGVRHQPTPADKNKLVDHTLHAVCRVGTTGEDARGNLRNLESPLFGISSGETRLYIRHMLDVPARIRRRAGTFGYPIYLNVPEFTAIMGWELDGHGSHTARRLEPTPMHDREGITMGVSNHPKTKGRIIAMPHDAGDMHVRVMGGTGTGKSTWLMRYGLQKIIDPNTAFFLLEPAGDLAWDMLCRIPDNRVKDVIYLDPLDERWPVGLNPLRGTDPELMSNHVVSIFHNLYKETWSPQMHRVLTAAVRTSALLGLTLYDTEQLLVNEPYRREQLRKLSRQRYPDLFQEWTWISDKHNAVVDSSVVRLKSFLQSRMMRNVLAQYDGLDFDQIIREHKILLVSLPAARMGPGNASAVGQLVREMAWNAAMKQPMDNRQRSVVMMDEFQNFSDFSTSRSDPFAEARKYRQQYVIANQYTEQISEAVRHTVDKNVATQIVFRLDPEDAKKVKDRYKPLTEEDIASLPRYTVAARIMSSQGIAPTVTFNTLPPPPLTHHEHEIIAQTRELYAKPVGEVEADILTRHKAPEQHKRPEIENVEE